MSGGVLEQEVGRVLRVDLAAPGTESRLVESGLGLSARREAALSARVAALEAEREKLRAVVLAVADHTVPCSEDANDVGESLAVALEAALGLPPQSEWVAIESTLRALGGAS